MYVEGSHKVASLSASRLISHKGSIKRGRDMQRKLNNKPNRKQAKDNCSYSKHVNCSQIMLHQYLCMYIICTYM